MKDHENITATGKLYRRDMLKLSLAAGVVLAAQSLPATLCEAKTDQCPQNRPDHAAARFLKSMNCSQAILETYAPSLGMNTKMARRIAAPFAGGMGMGTECGAVTGAFLVIGLKYGKTKDVDPEADKATFGRMAQFVKEFKVSHGHIGCSELLGMNMGTPEGIKEAEAKGLFTKVCPTYVRSASEILEKVLA